MEKLRNTVSSETKTLLYTEATAAIFSPWSVLHVPQVMHKKTVSLLTP